MEAEVTISNMIRLFRPHPLERLSRGISMHRVAGEIDLLIPIPNAAALLIKIYHCSRLLSQSLELLKSIAYIVF
jgi:hypothetical protein